jgi:hypothetical protein
MLASANHFGFNRGTDADRATIVRLLDEFAAYGFVSSPLDTRELGEQLARETAGGDSPIAVDVGWALASKLSNRDCIAINQLMTSRGVNMAATLFSDEFPKRVKTSVLGRRIWNWRIPAAFAATVLMAYADDHSLASEEPTA